MFQYISLFTSSVSIYKLVVAVVRVNGGGGGGGGCGNGVSSRTNLNLSRARICLRIRNAKATRTCHAGANNPLNLGATTINVDHKTTLRV